MSRYTIRPHPVIRYRKEGCVRVYDAKTGCQGDFGDAAEAQLYVDMVAIDGAPYNDYVTALSELRARRDERL